MSRAYAVVWCDNGSVASGRLDTLADRFELAGREQRLSIPFEELESVAIERARRERLRGLPVLALGRVGGLLPVRIASLEGTAALHELLERAGPAAVRKVA